MNLKQKIYLQVLSHELLLKYEGGGGSEIGKYLSQSLTSSTFFKTIVECILINSVTF